VPHSGLDIEGPEQVGVLFFHALNLSVNFLNAELKNGHFASHYGIF
jgi:hypothetical protein